MTEEPLMGLSTEEARRRLGAQGPNAMPDADRHGWAHTLREVFTEPMFVLLLVAAGLYLLLGDWGEGLLLSAFAVLTVALVVVQSRRREHALQALRELAVPWVRVHRSGQWLQCPATEVVCGDWLMLSEGDRVAADGVLRRATDLRVDEALLTGESWPVDKWPRAEVWAGTLVVAGHGVAEVTATGSRTRMGGIGQALSSIEQVPTPLQLQVQRLVRGFGALAAVAMALVVLWWGTLQHDWVGGVLSALALGMGMLPEEFPMALAVFMSMGAWRLSRLQVLARRPAAIEALGTTTLLCVDKTGTLTENRLRLVAALPVTSGAHPAEERLLQTALMASRRTAVDPIDRALAEAVASRAARPAPAPVPDSTHFEECQAPPIPEDSERQELLQDWPVQPGQPMTVRLWKGDDGKRTLVAKGSPEHLASRCVGGEAALRAQLETAASLASQGLRVLAVAQAAWEPPWHTPREEIPDVPLHWQGLLAFEDPLRPTVPAAVKQAHEAGIAVCLITGDHAQTALAIARQAGIDTQAGVMDGPTFEALDEVQQRQAIQKFRVFARVSPLTKLRLVQQAQANGEVVAMTGDGVNDAPALKAAHIGVAMGRRGTDVAREASSLVLMREDFSHLVAAIAQGRTVFDNLRKVSGYIASIHIPLVGLTVLPLLLGWPPLVTPAHVVLTQMVIDPMCSLAFEAAPASASVMKRPPRSADEGLLGGAALGHALAMGLLLLTVLMTLFAMARAGLLTQESLVMGHAFSGALPSGSGTLRLEPSVDQQRTLVMSALLAGNLSLVALKLTEGWRAADWRSMAARVYVAAAACAGAFWWLALHWPPLGALLQLQPVPMPNLLLACGFTVAALAAAQRWLLKR